MATGATIQINTTAVLFVLLWLGSITTAGAQLRDSLPVSLHDSAVVIKQLVKENLLQQLQRCGSCRQVEKSSVIKILSDTTMTDSLTHMIILQMLQMKNMAVRSGKPAVNGAVQTSRQQLQQSLKQVMQLEDIKGLVTRLTGIVKQPVLEWKGGEVSIAGQAAPASSGDGNGWLNTNTINGSWMLMRIPLDIHYTRQNYSGPSPYARNLIALRFDKEALLQSLRGKIKLPVNANEWIPDYSRALLQMKQTAFANFQLCLDSINKTFTGSLASQLKNIGSMEDLINNDMATIKGKLLSPGGLQELENKKNQLTQLQEQLSSRGVVDKPLYDSLIKSAVLAAGNDTILHAIEAFKDRLQKNGLLQKLQQAEQIRDNQLQQCLRDPDKALAKEQLDLSGMQKFFLNISQLSIGPQTVSLSPLTLFQYPNNGISAAFFNNNNYLFLLTGRQSGNSGLFNQFATPLFATGNSIIGIRAGKGDLTADHTHFSFFSYHQRNESNAGTAINAAPGSTIIAALSKHLKFNKNNYVQVELSESMHKYSNEQNIADTLAMGRNFSKNTTGNGNILRQLAMSLQWNGTSDKLNLEYEFHSAVTGKGYNNPGSFFLAGGTTEAGGSLKKSLLKSQLQLSVKGGFRGYSYSSNNTSWRNYNVTLRGKWKLRKGRYVSLQYLCYQTNRCQYGRKYTIGENKQLSLEVDGRKRFATIVYQGRIGLSFLKSNYGFDTGQLHNTTLLLSAYQTCTINRKTWYLDLQYNKPFARPVTVWLNTRLNAEAGLMYAVRNGISCSTGINYSRITDLSAQWGLKQTINGQLNERFVMSLNAAIGQNTKVYWPGNTGSTRIDWSLQYLIK